ncbi:PP2C family serine/threonine-protein phosphatase [Allokutzneria sp. NRRL B-24872]|uniref:PP2C family protein-serine/threonine phosphatase n=1 Tax=Allokutzneria sp. NRRL B-24872 TaxID=1137961 RepID=UPI000A381E4E|nr:hypothetical protein [Allokutzneria sp. NRRL B-24872]
MGEQRRELVVGMACEQGPRPSNADAIAAAGALNGATAIAVVDGIGGDEHVVAASPACVEEAVAVGAEHGAVAGLLAAGEEMRERQNAAAEKGARIPDAVAAVAVYLPELNVVEVAWTGDCRVWTLHADELRVHTVDHTQGQRMREYAAELSEEELADYDEDPNDWDHVVLTTLGRAHPVDPVSFGSARVSAEGVLAVVVGSDGFHKSLSASEIADVLRSHPDDAQEAAEQLVTSALTRSAEVHDNVTAGVLPLVTAPEAAEDQSAG